MKTKLSLLFVLLSNLTFAQTNWNIEFETDKHQVTQAHQEILNEIIKNIQNQNLTDYTLFVNGHTDNVGDFEYNQKLSLNRAKAVKDYLVRFGVSIHTIEVGAFSYSSPIAENSAIDTRARNRRTEVLLISNIEDDIDFDENSLGVEEKDLVPVRFKKDFMELYPKHIEVVCNGNNEAVFEYRCGQSVTIIGNDGCRVEISKGGIDCDSTKKLKVKLQEVTSKDAMMNTKASTRSGDQLLRSGGMFFVNLHDYSTESCVTITGRTRIIIPAKKRRKGMKPYFTTDFADLSQINWQLDNERFNIRYDKNLKAYILETTRVINSCFGCNCDAPMPREKELIVKTPRRYREQTTLAVVYSDESVSNMYQLNAATKKYYVMGEEEGLTSTIMSKLKDAETNNEHLFEYPVKVIYKKNGKPKNFKNKRINGNDYLMLKLPRYQRIERL